MFPGVPIPNNGLDEVRNIGECALCSINGERLVLTTKEKWSVGVQAFEFGSAEFGLLPDLHQLSGVETVEIHQSGYLVVEMLD